MDGFLSRRVADRRFTSMRVDMGAKTTVTPWYHSTNSNAVPSKRDNFTVSRHTASALSGITKTKHTFTMAGKKKRRPKTSGSGSESYSSSSESDGGGNRRSKKKKGRCWKGYKPTPGKKPYSDGSCQKA